MTSAAIADLLAEAQRAMARRDPERAVGAFGRILAIEPGHPIAANALGMRALERGALDEAERYFVLATQGDPHAPELWMNVATVRRRRADDAGERDALHRVLDLDQRHIGGLVRLAELHERRGELGLATYRWSALLDLARGIDQPAPGFAAILDHARGYVEANARKFADIVEGGLAPVRAASTAPALRRFDACIDKMLGRRRIYTNECHGLHFPFLPADEFFDRAHFDWLPAIEADYGAIRNEAESLLAEGATGLVPYVSMGAGAPTTKWSALDNSLDWSVFYLWRFGERHADACRRCPATAAALERVPMADMPRRAPTAFFSILKPHTRLPAHTGVSNARAIVHLPLIVPPGCGFRVGGEIREWREGEAFVFDDTIEHEAWNDSDSPRVVLILDVWNPYITIEERALLRRYFDVADASGFDPGMLGAVHD